MSTRNRRITYWSFEFVSGEEHFFDAEIFTRFMKYVQEKENHFLYRDEKQNKAISIESVEEKKKKSITYFRMIFKSCKYNHSPDYMSSVDGSERPTDKLLSEGDKELTHMCYRMDENEAFTIFEERRNGVSIGTAVTYLNKRLKLFLEENEDIEDEFQIWASIIPPDDFITALGRINRISSAELFVEKKVIGSGYLNLMEIDANTNEDLSIVVKAKPRKTLQKRAIESVYRTLTTQGTEVQRIRVRGKDIDRMNVTIDSLNGKKADEVLVELNQNGVVDSYSIFMKMEELIGV